MKIKIIGDSIAAGVGSSELIDTNEIIFKDEASVFYKRIAPNSWWGLLEKCLKNKNIKIENLGCGGAYTYQILEHFKELINEEDDMIFILTGLNDRKRNNGLEELYNNLTQIINKIKEQNKKIILLTPPPSTKENENYLNRIYHTDEIVKIIKKVSINEKVILIDIYQYINDYLNNNNIKIEDITYGEGCKNDGLHPGDKLQKLMYEKVITEIERVI